MATKKRRMTERDVDTQRVYGGVACYLLVDSKFVADVFEETAGFDGYTGELLVRTRSIRLRASIPVSCVWIDE